MSLGVVGSCWELLGVGRGGVEVVIDEEIEGKLVTGDDRNGEEEDARGEEASGDASGEWQVAAMREGMRFK